MRWSSDMVVWQLQTDPELWRRAQEDLVHAIHTARAGMQAAYYVCATKNGRDGSVAPQSRGWPANNGQMGSLQAGGEVRVWRRGRVEGGGWRWRARAATSAHVLLHLHARVDTGGTLEARWRHTGDSGSGVPFLAVALLRSESRRVCVCACVCVRVRANSPRQPTRHRKRKEHSWLPNPGGRSLPFAPLLPPESAE